MRRRLNWRLILMCAICVQLGVWTDIAAETIHGHLYPKPHLLSSSTVYVMPCRPTPHLTDRAIKQTGI